MNDQPLLHTLPSSGSGTGLSFYGGWMSCSRAAWLRQVADEAGEMLPGTPPQQVGTIYHAFQELYRKPKQAGFDTARVEFVQNGGLPAVTQEEARLEAERLFRFYRGLFKPNDLGRVLACEERLVATGLAFVPKGMPLTIRVDLVTHVDVRTSLRMREARKINVPVGSYLVDFKTDAFERPATADRYVNDLQFMLYSLTWNALRPKQKLSGSLIDVVFKTKTPSCKLIYIPPVGDEEKRIVSAYLENAWAWYQFASRSTPPAANPRACFDYNSICPWLLNERCRRH